MNSAQISPGDNFSIFLGGATAPSAIYTSHLHCSVVSVTEKAVQVRAYNSRGVLGTTTCWFPRRALITWKGDDQYGWRCKLAHWFTFSEYTSRFVNFNSVDSGIAA